jgi:prophage antirepressor-like protein
MSELQIFNHETFGQVRSVTLGGEQNTRIISLDDLCRLIVKAATQSRNTKIQEKAEAYESWIFDEVLPAIHKTVFLLRQASPLSRSSRNGEPRVYLLIEISTTHYN